jgi:hypothetical protein
LHLSDAERPGRRRERVLVARELGDEHRRLLAAARQPLRERKVVVAEGLGPLERLGARLGRLLGRVRLVRRQLLARVGRGALGGRLALGRRARRAAQLVERAEQAGADEPLARRVRARVVALRARRRQRRAHRPQLGRARDRFGTRGGGVGARGRGLDLAPRARGLGLERVALGVGARLRLRLVPPLRRVGHGAERCRARLGVGGGRGGRALGGRDVRLGGARGEEEVRAVAGAQLRLDDDEEGRPGARERLGARQRRQAAEGVSKVLGESGGIDETGREWTREAAASQGGSERGVGFRDETGSRPTGWRAEGMV